MSIIEKMKDPDILATLPIGEKLYGALTVMVLGLVTCIGVLTIIILFVKIMHAIMSNNEKKAQRAADEPAGEIDPETAAAIVSAVSEMEGGKPFKVRSIQQVEGGGK
ncbi:MAG: OadG family protein [Oscillospiraceae bacterium]|nr:OadG family protein [Oscillospiraceae bacterium]